MNITAKQLEKLLGGIYKEYSEEQHTKLVTFLQQQKLAGPLYFAVLKNERVIVHRSWIGGKT